VLKSLDVEQNRYYIILPEDEIINYERHVENIKYIGTKLGYMDYGILMQEGKIPRMKFDEVWVLSISYDKRFSYTEVYAVISKVKFRYLIYKVIDGNQIKTYEIKNQVFFSGFQNMVINFIRAYADMLYFFERKVKGYRW